MKRIIWLLFLGVLFFSTPVFAQAPTVICFNAKNPGGTQYCQPVDANNPFPVAATITPSALQNVNLTQILGCAFIN